MSHTMQENYCHSPYVRKRLPTHEVRIGDLPLGAQHPIRVQSMTTTDTMDTEATVQQTLRMVASGAEYVRITAPSIKEAKNLAEIKKRLRALGCQVPLIADIHFTPNAAASTPAITRTKSASTSSNTPMPATKMSWSGSMTALRPSSRSARSMERPCGSAPTTAASATAS
jgi:GcpE protein